MSGKVQHCDYNHYDEDTSLNKIVYLIIASKIVTPI